MGDFLDEVEWRRYYARMMTLLILSAALVAQPLPARVEPIEEMKYNGKWIKESKLEQIGYVSGRMYIGQPEMHAVKVNGRDPRKIKEGRDPHQTYAIFWTASTNGYQVRKIVGDKYERLRFEGEPPAGVHLTSEDAHNEILRYHLIACDAAGVKTIVKRPVHFAPSATLRKRLIELGKLDEWDELNPQYWKFTKPRLK
jgi:hypothetical protein